MSEDKLWDDYKPMDIKNPFKSIKDSHLGDYFKKAKEKEMEQYHKIDQSFVKGLWIETHYVQKIPTLTSEYTYESLKITPPSRFYTKIISTDNIQFVEEYITRKEAKKGHLKWIARSEKMTELKRFTKTTEDEEDEKSGHP